MKRKLLIVAIITVFSFNLVSAENESGEEVIGVDHETGIIAAVIEDVKEVSQGILGWIDGLTERGVDEVERRQEIIEDQVETRKKNLFISIKNSLQNFINSLVDSILDSLMAPFESFSNGDIEEES